MSAEKEAPYCLICKQNIFCRCPNSIKSDNPYVVQFVLAYREKVVEAVAGIGRFDEQEDGPCYKAKDGYWVCYPDVIARIKEVEV